MHTDHINAGYIAWQCNSQAAIGGASVLLDMRPILGRASNEMLDSLQNIRVKSHCLFYDDLPSYPLYNSGTDIVYYAPFLCKEPQLSKDKQVLTWFEAEIESAQKTEIKLSEGDWLIINNHRMLHGREEFLQNSNRLLTRFWLSGK